jgi:hypothetical protein
MKNIIYNGFVNSSTILVVSWLSVMFVGRIYDFHQIYIKFIDQTNSEKWLLDQCTDDHFFHKMAYHTDVCAQVFANSQVSPILYAINGSMQNLKMCGLYDCVTFLNLLYTGGVPAFFCLVLVYVLTPSFLIPWINMAYNQHEQRRFDINCSPVLKQTRSNTRAFLRYRVEPITETLE